MKPNRLLSRRLCQPVHPRPTGITLGILLILIILLPPATGSMQVAPAAATVALPDQSVPASGSVKFPSIAAGTDNLVHLAGNADAKAAYWQKADAAPNWSERLLLGEASGQPDFATAATALGPDGSVYVAWIDQDSKRLLLRRTFPDGGFGPLRTVASTEGFAVAVDVGISFTTGEIFVTWRGDFRMRYRVSNNDGVNWSSTRAVAGDEVARGTPVMATGPNGTVVIAHASENGAIFASIWNGNQFIKSRVDGGGNFFADPSGAVGPDRTMHVAWRGVENNEVWYAQQRPDGTWARSLIIVSGEDRPVPGRVSVSADAQGNLYLIWISEQTDDPEVFAAFKQLDQQWAGPTRANTSGFIANVDSAANFREGTSFGHAVYESPGAGRVRYTLFTAKDGIIQTSGQIQVNNDAAITDARSVLVQLRADSGNPNQYQLSNDGVSFTDYAPFPDDGDVAWELVPAGGNDCAVRTVFAHLRNATRPTFASPILTDTILLDPGVAAQVTVQNPFLNRHAALADAALRQDAALNGAGGGDPRYTRVPRFLLDIRALPGECSGLARGQIGDTPVPIQGNAYRAEVPFLSSSPPQGANDLTVSVTDGSGNQQSYPRTIFLDTVPPVVSAGTLDLANSTDMTDFILVTPRFINVTVSDNLYGSNGEPKPFWGVMLANSPRDIAPNDYTQLNTLHWGAVPVHSATQTGGQFTFTVPNWSLFSGLPADQHVGDTTFYIYAALLDGAGNPSAQVLKTQIRLSADYRLPTLFMPLVSR